MKGKLFKQGNLWFVTCIEGCELDTYYPLSPYDEQQIREDSQRFDNIEARIAAYPEVEFELEDFWETGLEEVFKVAKLKKI